MSQCLLTNTFFVSGVRRVVGSSLLNSATVGKPKLTLFLTERFGLEADKHDFKGVFRNLLFCNSAPGVLVPTRGVWNIKLSWSTFLLGVDGGIANSSLGLRLLFNDVLCWGSWSCGDLGFGSISDIWWLILFVLYWKKEILWVWIR